MKSVRIVLLGLLIFSLRGGNSFGETIHLRATDRVPGASGRVDVQRTGGATRLEVKTDGMKPATLFGGDYNTYVLWIVSGEGRAENAGELLLDGDEGKLRASTIAKAFGIVVTAEPHYLVNRPSSFAVLEEREIGDGDRIPKSGKANSVSVPNFPYETVRGVYYFERETLADVKEAKGEVHTDVKQAFTAVRLAQRACAPGIAEEALAAAQHSLDETLSLSHERKDAHEIHAQARETIQLAVAAQNLAQNRAFAAPVAIEGKAREGETGWLKSAVREAPVVGNKSKKEH